MRATFILFLILAASLAVHASTGSGLKSYKKGTLVIRVYSKKDLKGTACVIDLSRPNAMRTFSHTGVALIEDIEPGEYSAKVYRGSSIGFGRASVQPGDTVEMQVFTSDYFPGTSMLEGYVLEPNSREPVENAVVTSSAGRQITTDAAGYFAMYNHPAGDHYLSVRRDTVIDSVNYSFTPDGRHSDTFFLGSSDLLPVTKGLIAYYPLNGSAVDLGPHSLHGTVVGATAGTDRNGWSNGAMAFDGSSFVEIPHAAWQQTYPMSTSFWLKVAPGNLATVFIIGKYLHPTGEGWSLFLETGRLCAGDFRDGFRNWSRVNTTTTIGDNKWHHVVLTMGDGQLTMYVDGARVPARPYSSEVGPTVSTEPIRLGKINSKIWNPNPGLQGAIDDFAIYDRVLTEEEINSLMEAK